MKSATYRVIYLTLAVTFACMPCANAQSAAGDWKESVSGGFLYAVPIGSYNNENPAPGYTINYAYLPLHWLALETGFNQAIHPIGTIVQLNNGVPISTNTNDQLYLIPFGVRFVWQPEHGRARVSVGGGGAYLNHHFDQQAINSSLAYNTSGTGGQAVVSNDYALSPSGRYRIGLTARLYYVDSAYKVVGYTYHETDRVFTIGTEFTFSFH